MRRAGYVLATVAVLLAAAGCGSDPAPVAAPDPVIDINTLDVGPYDANPRDMGKPKNPEAAAMIEAERLGNALPLPMDVDPAFTHTGKFDSLVFLDPKDSALKNFANLDDFKTDAPDLVSGFVDYGRNDPDNLGIEMVNAAMIFPTEQRATDVAAALERRDFGRNPLTQAVGISKYPQAHAHWVPTTQAINLWYPLGRLVVYISFYDQDKVYFGKTDLSDLTTRASRDLDVLTPALQNFHPTAPDKLMEQPMDIDGMLGRTMIRPQSAAGEWGNPPGVYTGHAGLAFSTDPGEARKWWDADGVDRFADYGNQLYRTRDAAAAEDLRDQLGGPDENFRTAATPKNLPIARCREYTGAEKLAVRYYCSVAHDRYTAFAAGEQLLDAQQRISAQYAILVKVDRK
ncbi:MAG: hypothetical protein J2P18_20230 [Nocardia sp.]|nr:hypothetical protein [Nocardia sp.]